jgi:hypothetical protein
VVREVGKGGAWGGLGGIDADGVEGG